ncbi:MAG: sigma-70 family RNA polymerase sigma factor [Brachymonas sp.]|nr:sigma-70 family RNA polymerase sigma factor [Brachymonas sp.]
MDRPLNDQLIAQASSGLQPDPDQALVELARAGGREGERAFELLFIKYRKKLERMISRMVRDEGAMQDVVQESFIKAWRAMAGFRGESQFYTWLYRIAINTAKKHLVAAKRNPIINESSLSSGNEDDAEGIPEGLLHSMGEADTPEAAFAAQEIAQAVNAALEDLPEELRRALVLREMEGLSYEDISEAMDCPIGTVRSRIFRAREAISARIKPMLEHQGGKRW